MDTVTFVFPCTAYVSLFCARSRFLSRKKGIAPVSLRSQSLLGIRTYVPPSIPVFLFCQDEEDDDEYADEDAALPVNNDIPIHSDVSNPVVFFNAFIVVRKEQR